MDKFRLQSKLKYNLYLQQFHLNKDKMLQQNIHINGISEIISTKYQ